ncbi:c-type cytochrome [Bacteriovoracaceae bacterium]|nr:c-type cytochrome [Bacteriovoracaceae bacterium]
MRQLLVLFMSLIFSASVFANLVEQGQELFSKCASCHGKNGMGKSGQKAPMLAGQYAWYVNSQIHAIKNGDRANANTKKMMPFVKRLSDEDINALSAYVESMPRKK